MEIAGYLGERRGCRLGRNAIKTSNPLAQLNPANCSLVVFRIDPASKCEDVLTKRDYCTE